MSSLTPHALIVDDDPGSLHAMSELVEHEGFTTSQSTTLAEARKQLWQQMPNLILADLVLPDGNGTDLLKELDSASGTQLVVITGHASVDTAVDALRMGAVDYLTKPIDVGRLKNVVANAARRVELEEEIRRLRLELRQIGRFGALVGQSPPMQKVYELIGRVAPTDATVLLVGESGTGKDMVAQAIHQLSRRGRECFLPVNCGAIAANLIESELFGHERGSFTGADRLHRGYFERASKGTLFLDEITETPVEFQVKLLRVLETGTLLRVGGERPVEVDVRVIAATNRSPEEEMAAGRLREDLLYRLKVFSIELPPLRERADDIGLLAQSFLEALNRASGTTKRWTVPALQRLRAHPWPGNVRELRNVVEHAFILADDEIRPECLPQEVGAQEPAIEVCAPIAPAISVDNSAPGQNARPGVHLEIGMSIEEAERRLICATLEQFGGDKRRTAETLGISLKTLYNRLNAYKGESAQKR